MMPEQPAKSINERANAHGYELEGDFATWVIDLAKQLGCEFIYHTYNSMRSPAGFPDLVLMKLVNDRAVLVFLELKGVVKAGNKGSVRPGKASAAQQAWINGLKKVGPPGHKDVHAAIVYPWQRDELADALTTVFR